MKLFYVFFVSIFMLLSVNVWAGNSKDSVFKSVENFSESKQSVPDSRQLVAQGESDDLEKQIAFIINANGFLCSRVIYVQPLAQRNLYEVRCIEYRGGSGTVDYILNASTGVVFKR
ncbi:hypothetical protein [Oleidesulfovibrio alaskensis]|uniref:hypothetical protein n=1 Tax=Oleidesulfovibrio alaskensis TaxID=58180 RepID=UPI0012DC7F48|nr:hypothetical protein [Oleidesulfovibrio alaskensis]